MGMIRDLSIEGLECFARGGTGECYRLDDETILKLYYEGFPEEWALREKDCARTVFTLGVPTAISFHVARVGNRYGVIYETLTGVTLSRKMQAHPETIPETARQFAALAKSIHASEGDPARFGRSTDVVRKVLPQLDYADEATVGRIAAFMDRLDGYHQYIHGDFHPNNVMVCNGEPMLIDLGGFSVGCPMFDIATLRFCMLDSPEARSGKVSKFTGLTQDQQRAFWQAFVQGYFGADTLEEAARTQPDAALVMDVELLKRMRFERLYRDRFSAVIGEDYFTEIRNEVMERWGN